MIDRSLLSRLPTPALIKFAFLDTGEAVDHLRRAAHLCLDGARTLAFQDEQQKELGNKLIMDAIAFYDMALLRQRHPPSLASIATTRFNACTDPLPGSPTPWEKQFAQEIASGARCAGRWVERQTTQPLWWELIKARRDYPEGDRREAFEAGFLRHLQQRLIAVQYRSSRSPSPR
ncbi:MULTISPECIES: LasR-specific antiactivator QslA [unclassified Pseudomonas]|uniref:LasR-specific antiactivator QslA n=1 Tax=unclassified Pseudomonas TaxID=196821 RepID=UPI0015ACEBCC|nr:MULTISPECIES: LasR-specific antiactivator QslA [unclassified Pseudomonas]MCU1737340.1 LasR-specific antiactivator QslA [Pseudomonas sp. 20S_6.2_Bac1]